MEALGRLEEGLRFKEQALARNPDSPFVLVGIANSFWNQRRYDDVVAWMQRALAIDPRNSLASEFLGAVYLKQEDSRSSWLRISTTPGCFARRRTSSSSSRGRSWKCGRHSRRTDMRASPGACSSTFRRTARVRSHSSAPCWHGAAGELDAAFQHLDRALDLRDPGLMYLAVAPQWDSLRDDPRFAARLKRMGLRPV